MAGARYPLPLCVLLQMARNKLQSSLPTVEIFFSDVGHESGSVEAKFTENLIRVNKPVNIKRLD